ncbi:MAG: hypothetical protein QW478_06715 [Candidatus Micrarchaeaceae archaeon]
MKIDFANTSLDVIEGITAGGLTGLGAYIIGSAVASLPSAFLAASVVTPLSVIAGALAFVGFSLPNIRTRIKSEQ